ncbi:unnamed protein product [Vicia faba]|uniref:Uncharacterized protein n=1 Tax=Vicia faba TaxID=3906 RepID=A0AAV1AVK3_VICFA|nr:unnamed protein product [Vicia faba]
MDEKGFSLKLFNHFRYCCSSFNWSGFRDSPMAPTRKKGAKKSLATAAASREWKHGDLVLAKVKGFPAWPATVSEPNKWGYSVDRKKIFVLFFGTDQIAFCNPADIEAFTEEKKQSLAKRQGRGADFVRALDEIIECYDKLDRGTQVDETSSGGEVANANVGNPLDPSSNSGFKDQLNSPWTVNSQMKLSNSMTGRPEQVYAAEDDPFGVPRNETYLKEATGDAVATGTVKSFLPVKQENEPVQRSRSSSKVQNTVLHRSDGRNNGGNNDGNISADTIQNKFIRRRTRHIKKSPDLFGCHDTDSSAFASNVSMVENGSDGCSLNVGSAKNSDLKLEQSEIIEGSKYKVELKKVFGRDMKAAIGKKKRKPNRTRKTDNACVQNANQSLQNTSENPKEICSYQDGDEHLPPSKRARVRMISSSSTGEEHKRIARVQEKSIVVVASPLRIITSPNCENGCLADGDSSPWNRALGSVSPKLLTSCSENGSQTSEVKKDQLLGFSMDDESALPPSKRIQRALKAMSAYAAEGACIESPPSKMPSSGRCCISAAIKRCSCMIIDNQGAAKIDSQVVLHEEISPDVDMKCCQVGSNQDSPGPSLPPSANESIRHVIHSNASDTFHHGGINLDPVAGPNKSGNSLPQNSIAVPQNMVMVCEDMKQTSGDSSKINDKHEVVKEVKFKKQEDDMISLSISDGSRENGVLGIRASSSLTDGGVFLPQGSPPNTSVRNVSTSDSSNIHQNGSCSPDGLQKSILSGSVDGWKVGAVANQQSRSIDKSTEAGHAALLYFEAVLVTLKRTKESIGRATRIAIDCAKFGIATKVVESLVHSLENEPSLRRRVDLFFLVDSIAQHSRGLKDDVGGVYPAAMQAVLPRLLSAVSPLGNTAPENRRQCLKVLRLWLERRILPESIIRHHIRELNSYSRPAFADVYSRRSLRTERSLDDPIRDMEGMHVDEYGSNSSFQLSGFRMPCMLEEGGSDSDGGNFEATAPGHDSETYEVQEVSHAFEKHRHVLEDVDGELEMEDVAPSFGVELNSICNVDGRTASQLDQKPHLSFAPRLTQDVPSSSPAPPSFAPPPPPLSPPPPPPPPPPTLHLMSATSDQYGTAVDSKPFTDSQAVHGKTFPSAAHPLDAPRNSRPMDASQFQIPECRDVQMQIPESPCSFNSHPVRPPENSRSADGFPMHNKDYILRPPHRVPSDQFSFIHAENRPRPQREVPPPPSYSNRQHFVQNTRRENFYNTHERDGMRYNTRALHEQRWNTRTAREERWNTRASREERWNTRIPHEERWGFRTPYEERWNTRSPYSDLPSPYDCHPSASTRSQGHGWRLPHLPMNYRGSLPFRSAFHDAIPVVRGPGFWRPRRTEVNRQ